MRAKKIKMIPRAVLDKLKMVIARRRLSYIKINENMNKLSKINKKTVNLKLVVYRKKKRFRAFATRAKNQLLILKIIDWTAKN